LVFRKGRGTRGDALLYLIYDEAMIRGAIEGLRERTEYVPQL